MFYTEELTVFQILTDKNDACFVCLCGDNQSLVTWDGDKLVCVQKGEKENRGWKHWLEGDLLYLVRKRGDML